MAQHRGSVLGEDPDSSYTQPSQKLFDTRMWEQARLFDRTRPIFVEGESSMIGKVQIPKNTWAGMRAGTVTLLEVKPRWTLYPKSLTLKPLNPQVSTLNPKP
jgi:tRNA 2-selenouridine synthase